MRRRGGQARLVDELLQTRRAVGEGVRVVGVDRPVERQQLGADAAFVHGPEVRGRADHEAGRNREARGGQLAEVGALAAGEQHVADAQRGERRDRHVGAGDLGAGDASGVGHEKLPRSGRLHPRCPAPAGTTRAVRPYSSWSSVSSRPLVTRASGRVALPAPDGGVDDRGVTQAPGPKPDPGSEAADGTREVDMKVLVAYATKLGGTQGIAETVRDALRERGVDAEVAPVAGVHSPAGYDAAVIGSGLYATHWLRPARRFVKRNAKSLRAMPVWLFSSGPLDETALDHDIAPVAQVRALMDLVDARGHATFGGRLAPDAKGFVAGAMAKKKSGDWRNRDHIRGWAFDIAAARYPPRGESK